MKSFKLIQYSLLYWIYFPRMARLDSYEIFWTMFSTFHKNLKINCKKINIKVTILKNVLILPFHVQQNFGLVSKTAKTPEASQLCLLGSNSLCKEPHPTLYSANEDQSTNIQKQSGISKYWNAMIKHWKKINRLIVILNTKNIWKTHIWTAVMKRICARSSQ